MTSRKNKKSFSKKWKSIFKKLKTKKINFFVLILGASVFLAVVLSGFYFRGLIYKERLKMEKDLEEVIYSLQRGAEFVPVEETSPETLLRLKKAGIERYFLSEVELIGAYYVSKIHRCLYEEGRPIYPRYVYETWSSINYPKDPPPQIVLIRYLLLPEDNSGFQPDKSCFIMEIESEEDWQEAEKKYGFSKSRF